MCLLRQRQFLTKQKRLLSAKDAETDYSHTTMVSIAKLWNGALRKQGSRTITVSLQEIYARKKQCGLLI